MIRVKVKCKTFINIYINIHYQCCFLSCVCIHCARVKFVQSRFTSSKRVLYLSEFFEFFHECVLRYMRIRSTYIECAHESLYVCLPAQVQAELQDIKPRLNADLHSNERGKSKARLAQVRRMQRVQQGGKKSSQRQWQPRINLGCSCLQCNLFIYKAPCDPVYFSFSFFLICI